jgi:O-Antigen ligase
VWLAVVLGLVAGFRPPRNRDAIIAVAGLALLAAWTLISIVWAPVAGNAYQAGQIAVLYVGGLIAASLVLRGRAIPVTELVLAAGTVVVIGYGLAGRLLPGLLHYFNAPSAAGRLSQPLTYWNAMGELAAIGFVLSARVAGDRGRPRAVRAAAAAAAVPLGVGLYISVSRGALFACFAGLVALLVLVRTREQSWAIARALAAAAIAVLATAPLDGFVSLHGTLGHQESQGVIALAILVVVAGAAAGIALVCAARERCGPVALPPHSPLIATGVIAAGLAVAILVGAHERAPGGSLGGSSSRLTSVSSDRYAYWAVAFRAFAKEPLHGVGAGNWSVYWLRWRHLSESAQDAHSLPIQVLAELGVVGILLLGTFLTGVGLAARRALARRPSVAGAIAGVVTYLAHAPLDWDWQMPAVTLVAVVLAGAILGASDDDGDDDANPRRVPRGADERRGEAAAAQSAIGA